MSAALVLGAHRDPPPGPIASSTTLRPQHAMPAPTSSSTASSSSHTHNHWAGTTAQQQHQHHSASAYSAYSSPASHSGLYTSPHQTHHMPSYSSPATQQSHLGYTGYGSTSSYSAHHHQHQQPQSSSESTASATARAPISSSQAESPSQSPHVPASTTGPLSASLHASSTGTTTGGGLGIAGMLNHSASSHSYTSRYGSSQHTPASHADYHSGYFASAPNSGLNGMVSPSLASTSGAGSTASMPAYSNGSSYMPATSQSHNHSHSLAGVPVSTPGSTQHSHGSYTPSITSHTAAHPGLHTPGLSTGVSGMGISPSTGLGVPVYAHLPIGNRHRVTTTMWEDESTMCFQVDAKGVCVARRSDNNMINGTKLLNVCGMTRGKRDGILKNEKERIVVKVGAMHLKGVWISFERAKYLAESNNILDSLYPLFEPNLHDFVYQPEYPRTALVMQSGQERNAQRPRVMGPMSGVPASTSSMSPPTSIASTMAPNSIASTLSMAAYSAPISTTYPGLSSVTHAPLLRSQTTPSFAMPLPRQSPVVTSSPSGGWGVPPPAGVSGAGGHHHGSMSSAPASTYGHSGASPSLGPVSSFHYASQYSSDGATGSGEDASSLSGGGFGSGGRPSGVDRRHTDPVGSVDASYSSSGPGQQPPQLDSSAHSYPTYSSYASSSTTSSAPASSVSRLPPGLTGGSVATSSSSGSGVGGGGGSGGGRTASGSVSSVNGPPAHVRKTSGLKRSHDASD